MWGKKFMVEVRRMEKDFEFKDYILFDNYSAATDSSKLKNISKFL